MERIPRPPAHVLALSAHIASDYREPSQRSPQTASFTRGEKAAGRTSGNGSNPYRFDPPPPPPCLGSNMAHHVSDSRKTLNMEMPEHRPALKRRPPQ